MEAHHSSRWGLSGTSTASIPGIWSRGRRNGPALQGPWPWGGEEEAEKGSEEGKWPAALGDLKALPPEHLQKLYDTMLNVGESFKSVIQRQFNLPQNIEHIINTGDEFLFRNLYDPHPIGFFPWKFSRLKPKQARLYFDSAIEQANTAVRYISRSTAQFYFSQANKYKNTGNLISEIPFTNSKDELSFPFLDIKRLTVIDLPSIEDKNTRLLAINTILAGISKHAKFLWESSLNDPLGWDIRRPFFVILDEAHNLIPAEPSSQSERTLREYFRTIAAEGRKYGLFLVLVSQRPDKLDPMVLSEWENVALMRLNSQITLNVARKRLAFPRRDFSKYACGLPDDTP